MHFKDDRRNDQEETLTIASRGTDDILDVVVVGYGPVGMAMAALLGQAGRRVLVLERYPEKYNLPRAASFDDETMRTLGRIGIADSLLPKLREQYVYQWINGKGDLLVAFDFDAVGRSGWAEWYMMYQPDLENELDGACAAIEGVEIRFGSPVIDIAQSADLVEVTVEGAAPITTRYLVGCDGGNSFVRSRLDSPLDDYGFSEHWLVCDFLVTGSADLPGARQICDPTQPISIIALGRHHHRFSFMLDSGADPAAEVAAERVWARVVQYLRPDQATLIRSTTYVFRSLIAERWRDRRIFLAGDAAHQMPPFLGQGMCSGIRDALNLAGKLDLALAGRGPDTLLDSYQSEREPHVRAITAKAVELGRVQTMRDPVAAAERDRAATERAAAGTKPEKFAFPPLGSGFFGDGSGARELFVQGRVRSGDRENRFDAQVGYGDLVLVKQAVAATLPKRTVARAAQNGVRLVPIRMDAGVGLIDIDGTYYEWMGVHECDAVAVRADFHVWDTAKGEAGTAAMLEAFGAALASSPITYR